MTLEDGVYHSDSVEDVLDMLVANAKEFFDTDLDDSDRSVIRTFYRPIAIEFVRLQEDIGVVLESSQIDNAQGEALDLLTALIGVSRREAVRAKGEVTFSREQPSETTDYVIPSGTEVQTEGSDEKRFETTESATLPAGETEVTVPIEATEPGPESNVTSNTITVIITSVVGIEEVTNLSATENGIPEETDDELRERAKTELSEGSRATQDAILKQVSQLQGIESVKIFQNGDEHNLGDRPGFEVVVFGGNDSEIGQKILETKAAGDYTYGGNFGTKVVTEVELNNGQTQTERFSRPEEVEIWVEISLETNDDYQGDDVVKDSVVDYIGGTTITGNSINGKASVGEDVLYGEVEYAIRDVDGVYDVTTLHIGTSSSPNGESNISIDKFQVSTTNALDGKIEIN